MEYTRVIVALCFGYIKLSYVDYASISFSVYSLTLVQPYSWQITREVTLKDVNRSISNHDETQESATRGHDSWDVIGRIVDDLYIGSSTLQPVVKAYFYFSVM